MKNHPSKGRDKLRWLGGTRDDAAGECFDKCGRLLGLGYPGGPAIAAEAAKFKVKSVKCKVRLPRPMINENNFDFSFSGLKTALRHFVPQGKLTTELVNILAFEIQQAITDVLVEKTLRAAQKYKVKSILLAGGVAANKKLREKFSLSLSCSPALSLWVPEVHLCTDNAAIVASCAYFNYKPVPWQKIQANPSLEIEEVIK
jgi:Metal-dependent proteases with possible chaperone activity